MKSVLVLCSMVSFLTVVCVQAKSPVQLFQADIFYEVACGNKKAIKTWLKSNPDLSMRNAQGQTLLHAAVLSGNRNLVKMLVKAGAWVNALDASGKTALDHAVESGHVKITYDLVKKKALIACAFNEKPLKDLIVKKMTRLYKIFAAVIAVGAVLFAFGVILLATVFTGSWDILFVGPFFLIPGMAIASVGMFEIVGLGVTSAVRTRKSYLLQS